LETGESQIYESLKTRQYVGTRQVVLLFV